MSKESRRAARLARESRRAGPGATPPVPDSEAGGAGGAASAGPTRGARPAPRPVGGVTVGRAGRRDRVRPGPRPSFFERYRSMILGAVAVVVAVLAVGYLFIGATQPAYACTTIFNPSPTPPIEPGSSTRLGFFEEDMGNSHVVNPPQRYLLCPPASGNHYNAAGLGPIQPRVYKPDDKVGPSNWVHNLEHGGMVILYKGDSPGATTAGQQAFRDYAGTLPPSPTCKIPAGQLSPVIARFDDMPHPYAALIWDRVFYLDTWDPALVTQFYVTESERLDANGVLVAPPEKQCAGPSAIPTVAPSVSAAPSGSAAASGSVGPASSAAPSASPAPSSS